MSRRGWLFLGVGIAAIVVALCCVGAIGLFALSGGDFTSLMTEQTLPYEVADEGRFGQSTNPRLIWKVDIIVSGNPTPRQSVQTGADVARQRLKSKPEINAIIVQVFTSRSKFLKQEIHAVALASSDGRAINGSGLFLFLQQPPLRDTGSIKVLFPTKLDEEGAVEDFDIYDCPMNTKTCAKMP
jgi:hypothetical protein